MRDNGKKPLGREPKPPTATPKSTDQVNFNKVPVVIAENGMSNEGIVSLDSQVNDPKRIDFIRRHLRELAKALADGTYVAGYFHWPLMDNFEWAEGYRERFGLVHVDYKTLERLPKDSARFYRRVIETNGAELFAS